MLFPMTTTDELLSEALRLTPDDRAKLVTELLATLEPDLPSERRSEAEWIQEIERRVRAAMAGDDPGVSWAEVRAKIEKRLYGR
jgi:putative addiction module component (TIGR02574 family)